MQVSEKEFYHIHRNNWRYSDDWHVGNILTTSKDNYNYFFYGILNEPEPRHSYQSEQLHLLDYSYKIINEARKFEKEAEMHEITEENILNINSCNSVLLNTLDNCNHHLEQSLKLSRELIFENIRIRDFKTHPSRLHCFWLCDKTDLSIWWEEFEDKSDKTIIKVKATGNVFKADGSFIHLDTMKFSDYDNIATDYWSGKSNSDPTKSKFETLFEGQIKIMAQYSNPQEI